MKIRLVSSIALITLFLAGFADGEQEADLEDSLLREGHPDQYLVKAGDTLWEIASVFLKDPWHWSEIWHVNPSIKNPHLIYPGDEIFLKYVGGAPQMSIKRGHGERTYKLKPEQRVRQGDRNERMQPAVRVSPLEGAIPAIPLDAVASLMTTGRIVAQDTLALAPRILAGKLQSLVFGPGDQFYARGVWDEGISTSGIFREGNIYIDPDTGEILGYEAIEVGLAKVVAREGDVITFKMESVQEDVRIGDRLMPTEERRLESTFYPTPPDKQVEGVIITVLGGVTQVGRNDVIVVNRGLNSGVDVGTVLAIAKKGALVRDQFAGGYVQLPTERAGIMMVFRSFEKMSYGLVLQATEPLRVGDVVRNP
ncbi:MAG: LysM peptidoglycan-binding domain-containing protein [Candidatus Azotimanducaceae bacterium WSBS_2022_MAG_OTU7]